MAEFWSLLLILAVVYLLECFAWLRRGAVAFVCWFGNRARLVFPGTLLSNWRGGLALLNPFPPFGRVFVAEQPFLSLSSDGIYSYSAACLDREWRPHQSAKYFALEKVEVIDIREKIVRINGEDFLKCVSQAHAQQLASFLQNLKKLSPSKRPEAIEQFVNDSFNRKQLVGRLEAFQKLAKPIRLLAHLLFFYVFALAPVIVWQFGLRPSWVWLVIGLLLQTISVATLFRRAHKKLYPEPNDDWFSPFLTILLAPSAAIRASDALSRNLLIGFHPLAVGQLLLPVKEFERFAAKVLRDLRFPRLPICPTNKPASIEVEKSFRSLLLKHVERFLEANGLALNQLSKPPVPTESVHRGFCPRCETQFMTPEGECGECGGRALQAFETHCEKSLSDR